MAFSVAPGSVGHPGSPPFPPQPNVTFETAIGDGSTAGDIYLSLDPATLPLGGFPAFAAPPCGPIRSNTQLADENGVGPLAFGAPNVGLGLVPLADNLDTLDLSDNSVVDFVPAAGDGLPDVPVFFSLNAATAAALGPVPPNFSPPSAATVYAYFPPGGFPFVFDYIPFFAHGLGPGDDIDALALTYSGAPVMAAGAGFGDPMMFSLTPVSPTLPVLASVCFGPGTATAGDVFLGIGAAPFPIIDAEMLGVSALRTGGPVNDNVDAIDICLETGIDLDFDFQDNGCDFDDDGDLIGDMIDNCPLVMNPTQADLDGDLIGDACDPDIDGDGVGNVVDNCPVAANPLQENNDAAVAYLWIIDGNGAEGATLGGDACDANDDNDGCTDVREAGLVPTAGGMRDRLVPWDFADVPAPALLPATPGSTRNRLITLADVLADLQYVGTAAAIPLTPNVNGAMYGSDLNGNTIPDGREYDRTPSTTPGQPWRSGPPNGTVTLSDVLTVLAQVGTNCT